MKHLLILISILLLSSPVIGQSGKPLGVIFPPTIMGNVSDSRQQILLNTLDEEVSKYFDVSPPTNVSSGDLPVVEDVFQLQIVEEDGDTQLSLRWTSGNERKVETDYCEGCKTKILNDKVKGLVEKLVGGKRVEVVVEKKPVVQEKKVEPEVVVVRNNDFNKYEKFYYKWYEDGYIWSKNGDPKIHDMYQGEFLKGIPNGYGKLTFLVDVQMFTFIGEFRNGEKHGEGKQYYQNGKIKFEGIWSYDKFYNVTRYDKNGNIDGENVNGNWNYFTPIKQTPNKL